MKLPVTFKAATAPAPPGLTVPWLSRLPVIVPAAASVAPAFTVTVLAPPPALMFRVPTVTPLVLVVAAPSKLVTEPMASALLSR